MPNSAPLHSGLVPSISQKNRIMILSQPHNQKILITGASGFIGSFAVAEALRRGDEVWAGVRATSSKEALSDPRIHFIDLPYGNSEQLAATLQAVKPQVERWDVVIHIMGLTKCQQKGDFDRVNFDYTRNLVQALDAADMRPGQFIYLSSLSAMGPGNEQTLDEIKSTDTPCPNTLYGQSTLKTETFLRAIPDYPWTILRPTGVYGPREKDYFVMLQTLQRHINPAIGFKPQYITFIYVKDLVKVIYGCIDRNLVEKTYLVADGDVWTSSDYVHLSMRKLGVSWALPLVVPCFLVKGLCSLMETVGGWFGKLPTLNKDKYNILSARNWKCEMEPLQRDLEFKADYPLDKGLEESIAWYRENHRSEERRVGKECRSR